MQLAHLAIQGLFGKYNHSVSLPVTAEDDDEITQSVVILHGPNGVGKTTMLRMLNGMMKLDFTAFRRTPFSSAYVEFNSGDRLTVQAPKERDALHISFGRTEALLHPKKSGPLRDEERNRVEALKSAFRSATEEVNFEYLEAVRLQPKGRKELAHGKLAHRLGLSENSLPDELPEEYIIHFLTQENRGDKTISTLASSVKKFITEAQLDQDSFFRPTEPDLFLRIIDSLTGISDHDVTPETMARTLTRVHERDVEHARLGLGRDRWDYEKVMGLLSGPPLDGHALAVLATYLKQPSAATKGDWAVAAVW